MHHTLPSFRIFVALILFAFPDLRALAGPCPDIIEGPEIMLRQSIGNDNSTTNDNVSFSTYSSDAGAWYMTPVTITAPTNLRLIEWRAIVSKIGGSNINWANQTVRLRVWSSENQAKSSPTLGDVGNFLIPSVTPPPEFAVAAWGPVSGAATTFDLRINLSSFAIIIFAGATRVVGLDFHVPTATSGLVGVLESTEAGPSDFQLGYNIPGGWRYLVPGGGGTHSGRYGIEVRGLGQHLRGDLDENYVVNPSDSIGFVEALLDPAAWPLNHPTIPIEVADMNCDGNIDGIDIAPLIDKILAP